MTRPIRVLVASHTYVVGANQAKLRALADTGRVEVGLLVPRRWRDATLGLDFGFEDATEGRVQVFPSPITLAGRVGGYVFSPPYAIGAIRGFRPDVLHIEAEAFSLVALELVLLARTFKVPVTLFCWENVERDLGPRRHTARLVTASLAHLFPGSTACAEVVRGWGYRGAATTVPQLGIHVRAGLQPRPFPTTPPRVGFVGRLVHHKGVDLLLRALADLRARGIEAQAVIVGTGPLEAELRALATDLGVADRVVWRGWVRHEEVPGELGGLDVLVLPSRSIPTWREQFGHVLIEAMAEGVPVVGSSCGAIPDVIGRDDFIFPEEDWRALADILLRLLTDRGFYRSAAEHAVERVRSFTNEAIACQMVPIWERIVGPAAAPASGASRRPWVRP